MKLNIADISIRTDYQHGDIGTITKMHGELYQFGLHFETYVADTLADLYEHLDPKKERVWLAEYEGIVIGSIAIKDTDDWAQLRYFLIDPAYRGAGLGRMLMNKFFEFMKSAGYTRSYLLTESKLKAAAHLYGEYGYRFVSRRVTDYGLEEIRYEMHLEDQ